MKKAANERTFIYVIQCGDFVKIGISGSPEYRMAVLRTGMPLEPVLHRCYRVSKRHARKVEAAAHRTLGHCRMNGEWFRLAPDDATKIVRDTIRAETAMPEPELRKCEERATKRAERRDAVRKLAATDVAEWRRENQLRVVA